MVTTLKNLVLLGGGHSHIFVLKSFGMKPVPGVKLTLVTRDILTPYSGMLPGYVAGHYTHDECHIDLANLARFAQARLVHDTCMAIDVQNRQLGFSGRPPLRYDCLSVDIGITPDLQTVPGLDCVTPVKPIDGFVARIDALLERARNAAESLHVVVVGGGAGGVEVAFALHHRMHADKLSHASKTSAQPQAAASASASNGHKGAAGGGDDRKDHKVSIFTRSKILSSHPPRARSLIKALAEERGISIHEGAAISSVSSNVLKTTAGDEVGFDECLWCTQAAPTRWLKDCDLPKEQGGFLAINRFLQSAGGPPEVFAAGDVATSVTDPRPKAGVFAVRQGQPLADNLRRFVTGQQLVAFSPQSKFLGIISTGNKHAIATRGGLAFSGDWLWPMKDKIDRAFMNKFGSELPQMHKPPELQPEALQNSSADARAAWEQSTMRCKGCAAKVSPQLLQRVLQSLRDTSSQTTQTEAPHQTSVCSNSIVSGQLDDAVVLQPPPEGYVSVQTVDFVNSFVDDPFVFGGIVALHAMSDCFAMGADPAVALAMVQVEHAAPAILEDTLTQMMHGAAAQLSSAGCELAGGHSAEGAENGLGFCITGHAKPDALMFKDKLKAGQQLVLTKPVGTGIVMRGAMLGVAHGEDQQAAWKSMLQSSQAASRVMKQFEVAACTDVTGFGLLGHAWEMAVASKVNLEIKLPAVPLLQGVQELVAKGIKSTATQGNSHFLQFVSNLSQLTRQHEAVLLDPQTSGGLLCGVDQDKCAALVDALEQEGYHTAVIGQALVAREEGPQVSVST